MSKIPREWGLWLRKLSFFFFFFLYIKSTRSELFIHIPQILVVYVNKCPCATEAIHESVWVLSSIKDAVNPDKLKELSVFRHHSLQLRSVLHWKTWPGKHSPPRCICTWWWSVCGLMTMQEWLFVYAKTRNAIQVNTYLYSKLWDLHIIAVIVA